jgi:hypothetical protein
MRCPSYPCWKVEGHRARREQAARIHRKAIHAFGTQLRAGGSGRQSAHCLSHCFGVKYIAISEPFDIALMG